MPVVFGYWKLRGLGQPVRYLLEFTGTDWEDKYYFPGPAPDYDTNEWTTKDKFSLGLPFPNLPYLIDGDVKLTQSKAIIKYIARKHDLVGTTEEERIRIDIMDGVGEDFRGGFAKLCYDPNFDNLKKDYVAALPGKVQSFSDYLGDADWFAGANLSWVDFAMYEILDQHRILAPEVMKEFGSIQKFLARFEKLPKIAAYLSSPRFFKGPLMGRTASFGNK